MSPTDYILEGTWEEIARQGDRLAGQHVRLTILHDEQTRAVHVAEDSGGAGTQIYFGMFPGAVEPTDEDFRSAEFHGDPDDGLDWS